MEKDDDGTEKLCQALYGRSAKSSDYMGGSEAKMLHDAVAEIDKLREALLGLYGQVDQGFEAHGVSFKNSPSVAEAMNQAEQALGITPPTPKDEPEEVCPECGYGDLTGVVMDHSFKYPCPTCGKHVMRRRT